MSVQVTVTLGDDGLVAVKRASADAEVERLRAEAFRLRRAGHPGVVALVRHERVPGGEELHLRYAGDPVERWRGTLAQAAGLSAAVAATLADLHDLGLVHGRLDPSHVLVGADGRPRLCGLSDPGEAVAADDVLAVGRLVECLLDQVAEPRKGPLAWPGGQAGDRKALARVVARAVDPDPDRRPSARALATSILGAVHGAELPRRTGETPAILSPSAAPLAAPLVGPLGGPPAPSPPLAAVAAPPPTPRPPVPAPPPERSARPDGPAEAAPPVAPDAEEDVWRIGTPAPWPAPALTGGPPDAAQAVVDDPWVSVWSLDPAAGIDAPPPGTPPDEQAILAGAGSGPEDGRAVEGEWVGWAESELAGRGETVGDARDEGPAPGERVGQATVEQAAEREAVGRAGVDGAAEREAVAQAGVQQAAEREAVGQAGVERAAEREAVGEAAGAEEGSALEAWLTWSVSAGLERPRPRPEATMAGMAPTPPPAAARTAARPEVTGPVPLPRLGDGPRPGEDRDGTREWSRERLTDPEGAVPAATVGRGRRVLVGAAAAGVIAVGLGAGALALTRVPGGAPDPEPADQAAACPPVAGPAADVDRDGCPDRLTVDGNRVSAGEATWELGEPGDVVAVGDWDCDGAATSALLRPGTGDVFVFAGWSGDREPVTVTPTRSVPGGVGLRVDQGPEGCDSLVVESAGGPGTVVEEVRA